MRERMFQAEVKADCKLFNCHYEKVPDSFPPPPMPCPNSAIDEGYLFANLDRFINKILEDEAIPDHFGRQDIIRDIIEKSKSKLCGHKGKSAIRFTPPKPYDSYLVFKGIFYAIEFKQHKSKGAFPFSNVSPEQVGRLSDATDNGGRGYIVLNIRWQKDGKREARNEVYTIDVEKFLFQKWHYLNEHQGRKSIPLDDIKNTWEEINRVKIHGQPGLHWDIEAWLQTHSEKIKVF